MKEIILYYSFTGNTKKYVEGLSQKTGADLYEIKELKERSILNARTYGCFQTLTNQKSKINKITVDLNKYDKIIIASPVWASTAAPAINNIFDILPPNKIVDIILTSKSGKSNHNKISKKIKKSCCQIGSFKDIKF